MTQEQDIADRLRAVAAELQAIAERVSGEGNSPPPVFPESARDRFNSGLCLNCEKKRQDVGQRRRGLCSSCYQKTLRRIQQLPGLESDLIAEGLITPRNFDPAEEKSPLEKAFEKAWKNQQTNQAVERLSKTTDSSPEPDGEQ